MPGGLYRRGGRRGAALVFALAVLLIVSLILFGVGGMTSQEYSLANTQRDSAVALDAAEAAMHWELCKMSRLEHDPSLQVDPASNPYDGPLPSDSNGMAGPKVSGVDPIQEVVKVYVTDGSGTKEWAAPGDFRIYAAAAVNGVSRSIVSYGRAVGPGDVYTLYGVDTLDIGSAQPAAVGGYIGSARALAAGSSTERIGTLTAFLDKLNGFAGGWASPVPAGWDWLRTGLNSPFPPVETVAERAQRKTAAMTGSGVQSPGAGDTWFDWFRTHNDNEALIKARDDSGALVDIKWPAGSSRRRIDAELFNENAVTSSGKPLQSIVLLGKNTLLGGVRGANFYFDHLELPAGRKLEVQNGVETDSFANKTYYGPVRVWLGPGKRQAVPGARFALRAGTLQVNNLDGGTMPDPGAFMIYHGSGTDLEIGGLLTTDTAGNNGLFATIYAFNADGAGGFGRVTIDGDLNLRGSIVGWEVRHRAGRLHAFLPKGNVSGGGDPLKYVLYYRLQSQWNEPNPASQSGTW